MTKQEAAIVSAYTGYLIGSFDEMHKYVEKIFNRPVFTHEFADPKFAELIKMKCKKDYINIVVKG